MTARTAALLKALFQQKDPQDFINDLLDSVAHAVFDGKTVAAGTLESLTVRHYQIAPAAISATGVHAAVTLADGATTTVTTAITNPDFPRTVTVKGNQAGVAGNVVINGTDIAGNVISDTIALSDNTEVEGVKAFKTVTSIVLPARVAPGDTVSIGIAKKFGLPHAPAYAGCLLVKLFDSSADNGSLAVSATLSQNLFALNGVPNGAKKVDLYYLA